MGLAAVAPVLVAIAAVVWPPVVRGPGAYAGVVWLGLGAALLIIPSLVGDRGTDRLRWPADAAAVAGSRSTRGSSPSQRRATLAGIGITRRALGPDVARRRRLVATTAIAVVLLAASGAAFAVAAVANELALRDRPVGSSPYGPAGVGDPVVVRRARSRPARRAKLAEHMSADADGRSPGCVRPRRRPVRIGPALDGTGRRRSRPGDARRGAHRVGRLDPGARRRLDDDLAGIARRRDGRRRRDRGGAAGGRAGDGGGPRARVHRGGVGAPLPRRDRRAHVRRRVPAGSLARRRPATALAMARRGGLLDLPRRRGRPDRGHR